MFRSKSWLGIAAFALAAASPASAIIVSDQTAGDVNLYFGPQTYPDKLHNAGSPDGNPVTLEASVSHTLWDYTTTDPINLHTAGNDGNGFATVTAANGLGFSDLTIEGQAGAMFTAMGFNVFPLVPNNVPNGSLIFGDITVYVDGQGAVVFNDVAFGKNGNKFWIDSDSGLNFTKLVLSDLVYDAAPANPNADDPIAIAANYESMRQVSIIASRVQTAVPEPSTWAMMIFGFGLVGTSLRRRRTRVAFV